MRISLKEIARITDEEINRRIYEIASLLVEEGDADKNPRKPSTERSRFVGSSDQTGAVNNEISGKTVQSVTIEPRSKLLPGAKEVVITFNETTDSLKILVTSNGAVKFGWRDQLHDLP